MSTVSVSLGIKNAGFKRGIDEARGQMRGLKQEAERGGGLFGKLGAGIASLGLAAAARNAISFAGTLSDTSAALNLNVEELQGLRAAFADSGTTGRAFDKSLGSLVQKIADAKGGNAAALASFTALGVSLDDLNSKSTGAVLLQMSDGFKKANGSGTAFSAVVDILGKGGHTMAAGMRDGAGGVRELADAADKMSIGAVAALDASGDQSDRIGRKITTGIGHAITGLAVGWDTLIEKANQSPMWKGWVGKLPSTGTKKSIAAAITAATAPKQHVEPAAGAAAAADQRVEQQAAAIHEARDAATVKIGDDKAQAERARIAKMANAGASRADLRREAYRVVQADRKGDRAFERDFMKRDMMGRAQTDANRAASRLRAGAELQRVKDLADPAKQAEAAFDKAIAKLGKPGVLDTAVEKLGAIEHKVQSSH